MNSIFLSFLLFSEMQKKSVSTQKTTKNTLCTIKKRTKKKYIDEYTMYKQTVQGMHRTIDLKRDDLVKILI